MLSTHLTTASRRLPNRRASEDFALDAGGFSVAGAASGSEGGSLGEIIEIIQQNREANSTAGIIASNTANAMSLALQFGCPLDVLRNALKRNARCPIINPLSAGLDLAAAETEIGDV